MASTIMVKPQFLQPAYNEMILVLDSDKKASNNFEWIIDIKTGTSSSSLTFSSRLKLSPNPDGYGVKDLHKHISSSVTYDINHTSTETFQRSPNTFVYYDIDLYETYDYEWPIISNSNSGGNVILSNSLVPHNFIVGDMVNITMDNTYYDVYTGAHTVLSVPTPTQLVIDATYITPSFPHTGTVSSISKVILSASASFSAPKISYNGVSKYIDFLDWDYTDYRLTSASNKLLTTITPTQNYKVNLDDRIWYNLYNQVVTTIDTMEVITYDNNGILIGTYNISNSYSANLDENRFLQVGVGPWNLINTTDSISTTASLPIITTDVNTYTIQMKSGIYARSSLYNFIVENPCTLYETFRLLFLDEQGSILSADFNKVNKQMTKIKRTMYKQNHGSYNPATNTWGYNTWDRGDKSLDINISDTIKLNSDWVNESQGSIIQNMLENPEVFHLREDGVLLPINILTNSYEKKTLINDILFNYKINFEYSFKNTKQRG